MRDHGVGSRGFGGFLGLETLADYLNIGTPPVQLPYEYFLVEEGLVSLSSKDHKVCVCVGGWGVFVGYGLERSEVWLRLLGRGSGTTLHYLTFLCDASAQLDPSCTMISTRSHRSVMCVQPCFTFFRVSGADVANDWFLQGGHTDAPVAIPPYQNMTRHIDIPFSDEPTPQQLGVAVPLAVIYACIMLHLAVIYRASSTGLFFSC